jgi:hypothetical protein
MTEEQQEKQTIVLMSSDEMIKKGVLFILPKNNLQNLINCPVEEFEYKPFIEFDTTAQTDEELSNFIEEIKLLLTKNKLSEQWFRFNVWEIALIGTKIHQSCSFIETITQKNWFNFFSLPQPTVTPLRRFHNLGSDVVRKNKIRNFLQI